MSLLFHVWYWKTLVCKVRMIKTTSVIWPTLMLLRGIGSTSVFTTAFLHGTQNRIGCHGIIVKVFIMALPVSVFFINLVGMRHGTIYHRIVCSNRKILQTPLSLCLWHTNYVHVGLIDVFIICKSVYIYIYIYIHALCVQDYVAVANHRINLVLDKQFCRIWRDISPEVINNPKPLKAEYYYNNKNALLWTHFGTIPASNHAYAHM